MNSTTETQPKIQTSVYPSTPEQLRAEAERAQASANELAAKARDYSSKLDAYTTALSRLEANREDYLAGEVFARSFARMQVDYIAKHSSELTMSGAHNLDARRWHELSLRLRDAEYLRVDALKAADIYASKAAEADAAVKQFQKGNAYGVGSDLVEVKLRENAKFQASLVLSGYSFPEGPEALAHMASREREILASHGLKPLDGSIVGRVSSALRKAVANIKPAPFPAASE